MKENGMKVDGSHPNQASLLPATTSTSDYHINTTLPSSGFGPTLPSSQDFLQNFLQKELCAHRLHDKSHLLWLAGRPLPPRPLHQQVLLHRQITISEPIELHLVWTSGIFFVKPLPRYLLNEDFVQNYIKPHTLLNKSALGLLFSYTALVRYESDFHIAQQHRLLPADLSWEKWQYFTRQFYTDLQDSKVYAQIDTRYCYGELRLGRLNKIYRLFPKKLSDVLYGYSTLTAKHMKGDVFSDNLRAIAATLAYFVIVLQAMQVGLTTDYLSGQDSFQQACYGFAIFSVVAPLAALGALLLVFLFLAVINFTNTLRFERSRFKQMKLVPPRLKRPSTEQLYSSD